MPQNSVFLPGFSCFSCLNTLLVIVSFWFVLRILKKLILTGFFFFFLPVFSLLLERGRFWSSLLHHLRWSHHCANFVLKRAPHFYMSSSTKPGSTPSWDCERGLRQLWVLRKCDLITWLYFYYLWAHGQAKLSGWDDRTFHKVGGMGLPPFPHWSQHLLALSGREALETLEAAPLAQGCEHPLAFSQAWGALTGVSWIWGRGW